jgi:hypothetical protein
MGDCAIAFFVVGWAIVFLVIGRSHFCEWLGDRVFVE